MHVSEMDEWWSDLVTSTRDAWRSFVLSGEFKETGAGHRIDVTPGWWRNSGLAGTVRNHRVFPIADWWIKVDSAIGSQGRRAVAVTLSVPFREFLDAKK